MGCSCRGVVLSPIDCKPIASSICSHEDKPLAVSPYTAPINAHDFEPPNLARSSLLLLAERLPRPSCPQTYLHKLLPPPPPYLYPFEFPAAATAAAALPTRSAGSTQHPGGSQAFAGCADCEERMAADTKSRGSLVLCVLLLLAGFGFGCGYGCGRVVRAALPSSCAVCRARCATGSRRRRRCYL